MKDLIRSLEKIGFTSNEAKVYITILEHNPCTAYVLGKNSEVSRTMVYDLIKRLVQKGAIIEINSKTKLYAPVPYDELLERYKNEYLAEIENIKVTFDRLSLHNNDYERYIININNYNDMTDEIVKLIDNAVSDLYISMWAKEAELFCPALKRANDRGVSIIFFSYGSLDVDFGIVYQYGLSDDLLKEIWNSRRLIVIADREKVIIGEGNGEIEEISYVTNNTMIVEMTIVQMVLDIIHLIQLKKLNIIDNTITSKKDYFERMDKYYHSLDIDFSRLPKSISDD
jgi:HTH-type transcriptional regulator, sugar sensing transcriptional regulator